jgi:glycerol kinase
MGAAALAGLAVGLWKSPEELKEKVAAERTFLPQIDQKKRDQLVSGFNRAVECSRGWATE